MLGSAHLRLRLQVRRGRLGLLVLALLCLTAAFADVVAADRPILALAGTELRIVSGTEELGSPAPSSKTRTLLPLVEHGPARRTALTLAPPCSEHPLGTDAFGRDVLARLVHGARTAVLLSTAVAALAVLLGVATGSAAALLGGFWDALLSRAVEAIGVFPTVVLVALARVLDRGGALLPMFWVLALVKGAEVSRVVRVLVFRCFAEEWALAARALGSSGRRTLLRQIAPHLRGAVAVSAMFSVTSVVLTEAALSFLGLGQAEGRASWGEMLGEIRWGAGPWVWLPPALALAATLAGTTLLVDALDEERRAVREWGPEKGEGPGACIRRKAR